MFCEECKKNPSVLYGGVWLCCGQLHCKHVKECPICNSKAPKFMDEVVADNQNDALAQAK
jgi:hypothetical protein